MKIPSVEAGSLHAGGLMHGRTDIMNVIDSFRNFANVPKTAHCLRHIDRKPDHKTQYIEAHIFCSIILALAVICASYVLKIHYMTFQVCQPVLH